MTRAISEPVKTWDSTALLLFFAAINWIAGWLGSIILLYFAFPKKTSDEWNTTLAIWAAAVFLESSSVAVLMTVLAKAGRNALAAATNTHLLASQVSDLDGRLQRLERDREE